MHRELHITKTIPVGDIKWPAVLDIAITKFRLPTEQALTNLNDFLSRVHRPLNLYWFISSRLSDGDNSLVASACDLYGTDALAVTARRALRLLGVEIAAEQTLHFVPQLRRGRELPASGRVSGQIRLRCGAWEIPIVSLPRLLIVQLSMVLIALASSALTLGVLLYGISILSLFLVFPGVATIAALNDARFGLALLAILVASAALCGSAIRRPIASLVRYLRARRSIG